MNRNLVIFFLILWQSITAGAQMADLKPEILNFEPFVWNSEPPEDCPFEQSETIVRIKFSGIKSGYHYGDTWYPTWAANDTLYSPWTDGKTKRLDGYTDWSQSWVDQTHITTGQGVIVGDSPLSMKTYSIGLYKKAPAFPYHGRYPCGSLIYNSVWYYGTYCLDPSGFTKYGDLTVNWPWMGPFVGFRYSTDYGHTWTPCPHEPADPIFGETGINGYPVKIGAPHFVDFGKNMQYSPDGKAYLVAHGADTTDTKWRFWNDSWITGDQVTWFSPEPEKELFRRTINETNFRDANSHVMFNIARARLSMPEAVSEAKNWFASRELPNGLFEWAGHAHGTFMPEMIGIAALINEFMLQSVQNRIRLFPCWPVDMDAEFYQLRAQGGFIVSAAFKGGKVASATIETVSGNRLQLLSPWKTIYINSKEATIDDDGIVTIDTKPDQVFQLSETPN